ncbi:MAG TPA: cytochrome-c peroxidase [Polyangiales bacterium]|nr:cytochrome-c peroxidase [Polyangiales bacterium]
MRGKLWKTLGVLAAISGGGCDFQEATPSVEPPSFGRPAGTPVFTGAAGACPAGPIGFTGSGGVGGLVTISPGFGGPPTSAEQAPPPISGGTLLTSADGSTLVAADPDRDAIYLIDVAKRALVRRIALAPGDEPGRAVQDKSGTVHVALRGGKALASFGLAADAPVTRTPICDLPRGVAYDSAEHRVYVACAEGVLVQVDPAAQRALRKVELGRDLRDVIVRGGQVLVSRFRSAELLRVSTADGQVMETRTPPSSSAEESVPLKSDVGCAGVEQRTNRSTPNVAWRTIDVPGRGAVMLHQRSTRAEVRISPGGYGGGVTRACAPGIAHAAISVGDDASGTVDLSAAGLFVDVAADPTGSLLALANPGGWGTEFSVMIVSAPVAAPGGIAGSPTACQPPVGNVRTEGQPTAVSFVSPWLLAIQEREPAGISFFDTRAGGELTRLDLQQPSRYDAGHTLFHLTTRAGLACASCHAEAGDDGHVWTFEHIGARRTQNLRGGILGSEPFHWDGDMRDFSMLVSEVFVGRMTAPKPTPEQAQAMARWIDRQPLLRAQATDAAAAERGKALFESEAVGCASCHFGARLSNNLGADVGTGELLQVPSLRAISFRAPFMHDGCAATLRDRFGACGGGDKHGRTSQLRAAELDDLVAYLETL